MSTGGEKAQAIVDEFFAGEAAYFTIQPGRASAPMIAARMSASTRSFTAGQRVFAYDGYWGMAERVMVIGRYRRKHRFIRGVVPIARLGDGRPAVVYDPAVLRLLDGARIARGMFLPYIAGNAAIR